MENWNPLCCKWECKMVRPQWKRLAFLKSLNIELPYDPYVLLLVMYQTIENIIHSYVNLYMNVYNSLKVETTKCPSSNWWKDKIRCIHTMEYYSVRKRNEVVVICYNMDEPCKHALWKKPSTKGPLFYMIIIHVKCSE